MPADPGDLEAAWKATDDLVRAQTAEVLDPLGVRWTFQPRSGEPAAKLEAAAADREADLIVVGSRGHVVKDYLLGSVSIRLIHHARRPVMVVR